MNKNIHTSDEEKLREKLQHYQPTFDEHAWTLMQQQLAPVPVAPPAPCTTLHTRDAAAHGIRQVYSLHFIITQLYYTMFTLLISLTLSGSSGRIAPASAYPNFPAGDAVPARAMSVLKNDDPGPAATTPSVETANRPTESTDPGNFSGHSVAHKPDQAVSDKRTTRLTFSEKKDAYTTPHLTQRIAQSTRPAHLSPVTAAPNVENFVEGTTPVVLAVPRAEVYTQEPALRQDTVLHGALPAEKAEVLSTTALRVLPASDYVILSRRQPLSDSVSPFRFSERRTKHFDVGASVLRGFQQGMLLRADFIRMFFPQFGVGATLTVAQYDQYNSSNNTPNYQNQYYVSSTGLDLTALYNWRPFRRISFQTFGGLGVRTHLVSRVETTSSPISTRVFDPERRDKAGFDLGANLLFHVNKNFQAGVQYVWYKDYLDDIPALHFGGFALRMKF